jgi:RNA polymerase sigma factor (sigma-70 family)
MGKRVSAQWMQEDARFHKPTVIFFLNREKFIQALPDEELVVLYKKENDNIYLGELFGRYIQFVFLVCMKHLRDKEQAKDIAMQVFEKLPTDLHRFEVRQFRSWLHVVCKNACFMHARGEKKQKFFRLDTSKEQNGFMENIPELHPDDEIEKEWNLNQLEKALETLEPAQKQCVKLFYLQGNTYKEVATTTGFSENQVKSYIQNGKRNLKNYLVTHGELLIFIWLMLNHR